MLKIVKHSIMRWLSVSIEIHFPCCAKEQEPNSSETFCDNMEVKEIYKLLE